MDNITSPEVGQLYTRKQIHQIFGGDLQSYLPHVDGKVVCGCFTKRLDPRAPFEILVGSAPNVVKYAKILIEQSHPIPIFIKRNVREWEFVGYFRVASYTTEPSDVLRKAKEANREKVTAVLSFLQVTPDGNLDFLTSRRSG